MSNLIVFLIVLLIAIVFIIILINLRNSHIEKLKMIEKGLNPEKVNSKSLYVRLLSVIIGLSLGLLLISFLIALDFTFIDRGVVPVAILLLFGATSLIIGEKFNKK